MLSLWKKYLSLIFSRTIVFYAVIFFPMWRMLDYSQLMGNAVPQVLSRLTPPMDYFAEFVDKDSQYDRFKLMNCINYHKAVAHYFPAQNAEAYGMLGFCYERLGRRDQAIAAYNQAIALNPDYFWPYYNLGVIYLKEGHYSQAQDYFRQSLQQTPIKTIVLLSRSKVYNDVLLSKIKGTYDYFEGLKEGRLKAYILMNDMQQLLNLQNDEQQKQGVLEIQNEVKPRVSFF